MRISQFLSLTILFVAAFLAACGGGGGGSATADSSLVPSVRQPQSPTPSAITLIQGVARKAGSRIEVLGGASPAESTAGPRGDYSVQVPLRQNALNSLYVREWEPGATQPTPVVPVEVIQDSESPVVHLDSPGDGAVMTATHIDLSGRVADVLSGFQGLRVLVNSQQAQVNIGQGTNGTWSLQNFSIATDAATTLQVSAFDAVGNRVDRSVTVFHQTVTGPALEMVSGNYQTAQVGEPLAAPLLVLARDTDGTPLSNKQVRFQVTQNDGRIGTDPALVNRLAVDTSTDANGLARVFWRLGGTAGQGNHRVQATSTMLGGILTFSASATAEAANQINVSAGDNQRGTAGAPLAIPLRAWVSDSCNGVANVEVLFTVEEGGGHLTTATDSALTSSKTVRTNLSGHAEVNLVLGTAAGRNRVKANFTGNAGAPAMFTSQSIIALPGHGTTLSGMVEDNAARPLGGADIRLTIGTDEILHTRSGLDGTFLFETITTSGPAEVYVDGQTVDTISGAPTPTGSFPSIRYRTVVLADVDNRMTTPVLLPPLNPANRRLYSTTEDTLLTIEGIEGLQMRVRAGSMRVGSKPAVDGQPISLNQVQHDDVPMQMPDGAAPPFAWTLQPAGAYFDPPVEITYPNMTGLPPGASSYFLTFNHLTSRFEIVAPGQVSNDGSTIISAPGSGIVIAGWGCNCPPYSVTGTCINCSVRVTGPRSACPGTPVVFQAAVTIPGGRYSWTGGTAVGPTDEPVYEATFASPGALETVTCTYTCPPENVNGTGGHQIEILTPGDLRFASDETAGAFVPAMETTPANQITPDGFFRFLVGNARTIQVRYCPDGDPNQNYTCSVRQTSGGPAAPQPAVGRFVDGQFTFTPQTRGRTVPTTAIQPVEYEVEVKDGSGAVVASARIVQDLIDRLRQEYIDRNIEDAGFNENDRGLVNGAPPREQVIIAPTAQIGGSRSSGCTGTCRTCPTPNYFDPITGIGLTWNNGNVSMFQSCAQLVDNAVTDATAGALTLCLHSGHRSPSHNKRTNGVLNSNHQFGRAVDMSYDAPSSESGSPSEVSRARFHWLLYRAALAITPGEVLLEIGPKQLLPKRWDPPSNGHVFSRVNQPSSWPNDAEVVIEDTNNDGLPDQVQGVIGRVPSSTTFRHLGGLATAAITLQFADSDQDGFVSPFDVLHINFPGGLHPAQTLDFLFANASHVHAEGFLSGVPLGQALATADGATQGDSGPSLVPLGSDFQASIGTQTVQLEPDGSFRIANISAADQFGPGGPGTRPDFVSDDFMRVVARSEIAGQVMYAYSDPFRLVNGTTKVIGDLYYTASPPLQPRNIALSLSTQLLTQVGQASQATVTATLSNGAEVNASSAAQWTTYRTSNPAVVAVDSNGRITATGDGSAFVTATNEGATAVRGITVSSGDPLTTVRGLVRRDGAPAQGALVKVVGFPALTLETTTDADGRFQIIGVPSLTLPSLQVTARLRVEQDNFYASVSGITPVGGSITDTGLLDLQLTQCVWESTLGVNLPLSDDDFEQVQFTNGFTFPFAGALRTNCFVGSNGYLTFDVGDSDYTPTILETVQSMPRISIGYNDWHPSCRGSVSYAQFADRFVVTWESVPEFSCLGSNTFQMQLFADGGIVFLWNGMNPGSPVRSGHEIWVGVSPGGQSTQPVFVDWSSVGAASSSSGEALMERFTIGQFDLDFGCIAWSPNANGGYDATFAQNIASLYRTGSVSATIPRTLATQLEGVGQIGTYIELRDSRGARFRKPWVPTADLRTTFSRLPVPGCYSLQVLDSGRVLLEGFGELRTNGQKLTINLAEPMQPEPK